MGLSLPRRGAKVSWIEAPQVPLASRMSDRITISFKTVKKLIYSIHFFGTDSIHGVLTREAESGRGRPAPTSSESILWSEKGKNLVLDQILARSFLHTRLRAMSNIREGCVHHSQVDLQVTEERWVNVESLLWLFHFFDIPKISLRYPQDIPKGDEQYQRRDVYTARLTYRWLRNAESTLTFPQNMIRPADSRCHQGIMSTPEKNIKSMSCIFE